MSETSIAPVPYIAVGLGFATVIFGVFVEKHFVSKWSILFNCLSIGSLALALKPSQILEFVLLVIYAIAGAILIASKARGKAVTVLKHLFGSKIYGSIALAYAFNDLEGSKVSKQLLSLLGGSDFFESHIVLFSWIIIVIGVLVASGIVLLYQHLHAKK
jgi:hypothetical protein